MKKREKSIAESFEQSGKSNQAIREGYIQHDDKMLA
jgi:hypothetical protein